MDSRQMCSRFKLESTWSWKNDSGEIEGHWISRWLEEWKKRTGSNNNAENTPRQCTNITLTTVDKSHYNPKQGVLSARPFYRRSLRLLMSLPSSIRLFLNSARAQTLASSETWSSNPKGSKLDYFKGDKLKSARLDDWYQWVAPTVEPDLQHSKGCDPSGPRVIEGTQPNSWESINTV